MSEKWRFRGRELDPAKLPTMDEIILDIEALGGTSVSREMVASWPYGEYGNDLAYWFSFIEEESGCVLMPVREGVLWVPFGCLYNDVKGIDLKKITLLNQEECWDAMDNCLMAGNDEGANVWEEAALICGALGIHEIEDDFSGERAGPSEKGREMKGA